MFTEDAGPAVEVWAHASLMKVLNFQGIVAPITLIRAMRQFGPLMEAGHINSGIGPRFHYGSHNTYKFVPPNRVFHGEEEDVSIAGKDKGI